MSIYIKGMDMPKDEAVAVMIHPDGTAYTAEMFAGVCTKYLADCTAVTVPPHGRLIDAEGNVGVNVRMMPGGKCEVDLIAPTIIPAEEGAAP